MISDLLNQVEAIRTRIVPSHNTPIQMAWRASGSHMGLCGLDLPERVGGRDLAASHMIEVYRYFGRIGLHLRDVPGAGHARMMARHGDNRHDGFLKKVAVGESFAGLAITEADAGSEPKDMRTSAEHIASSYRITGRKRYSARILDADHFIVFAHVVSAKGNKSPSAFLVPTKQKGINAYRINGMGHDNMSWGGLDFEDCIVPEEARIGEEGEAPTIFAKHFVYWRLMIAAAAIGCAEGALEQALGRSKNRKVNSRPIGCFSHIQQDLARHTAHVRMAWMLCNNVALGLDAGSPSSADSAMAKAESVEASLDAVDWAMRIHGAYGYTNECDLHTRLRDLMGLRIADGTTDVLRSQVARALLGEEIYRSSQGLAANQ